ncbi:hypothetical protein C8T65DRAFT_749861 [Cerioporus squamosus]|nr:hypothetical protein C8T65DRAFT_749861 [Cerioporus squamosus]
MTDWLETSRVLQRRLDDLVLPTRRHTMVDACLEHSNTFACLACFLAGAPHDDNTDYDTLEAEFVEAMQGFQKTYQKVRQWEDPKQADEVAVRDEPITPSLPALHSSTAPPSFSSLDDLGDRLEYADDTLEGTDDMQSTGSEVPSDKQWDPEEDYYMRARVSLIADLEDPLLEQLQQPLTASLITPLLEELTSPMQEHLEECLPARLGTSIELLDNLTTSLTQHKPFLDALADRLCSCKDAPASASHAVRPALASARPALASTSHAAQPALPIVSPLHKSANVSPKRGKSAPDRAAMKKPRLDARDT